MARARELGARRLSARVGLVAVVTSLGLVATSGDAEARWSAPQAVTDSMHDNRDPTTAGDGSGALLVAWDRLSRDTTSPRRSAVWIRRRDRNGHWGPRQRVSPVLNAGGAPLVAMNSQGQGVVVYTRFISGSTYRVVARRVSASGHVGRERRISGGEFVGPRSVVIDGAGDVVVSLFRWGPHYQVRVLRTGGHRTPLADLPTHDDNLLSDPFLATAGRHQVGVAWSDGRVHTERISVSSGQPRHDVVVSDDAAPGTPWGVIPHLARDGTLVVTWWNSNVPNAQPGYAAWRHPDGSVRRQRVTAPDAWVTGLWSTAGSRGSLEIAWLTGDGTFGPGYARHVSPEGVLSRSHRVVESTPGLVMTAQSDGSGFIWWQPYGGSGSGRAVPYSAAGRIGVNRRAPLATNPAAIAPVGGRRFAMVTAVPRSAGIDLSVRIGP